MKKVFSILILSALLLSIVGGGGGNFIYAEAANNLKFDVPKASAPPEIDGKMTGDEWNNALVRVLTPDNVSDPANSGLVCQGATFYWMWDDAGIYVFADVKDATVSTSIPTAGTGTYNAGDGIQVCIYADPTFEGANPTQLFFYSLIPSASDGNPYIGEHFVYSDGASGKPVPEAKLATVKTSSGYTIEAFISKDSLAKSDPPIVVKEGCVLPLANIVMEHDGSTQGLFTDTAWFSGVNANKYTLTASITAGPAQAEEVTEEIADATAAAETTAPAAPAVVPQTGDFNGYIYLLIILSAAAVIVISKKRKTN